MRAWRLARFLRRERIDVLQVYFPDSTYFGDSADYVVRLPGGAALHVTEPLGSGFGRGLMPSGTAVTVSWAPDACVLLSA